MKASKFSIIVLFSLFSTTALADLNKFSDGPNFKVEFVDCKGFYTNGTKCKELLKDFSYVTGDFGWEAKAGLITDGASIPGWAQWLIGNPLNKEFSRAATLHDHYCRPAHQVRPYKMVHRMFYDALLDSGVNKIKAGAMYGAVAALGPTWSVSSNTPVEECSNDIPNCIRDNDIIIDESLPSLNRSPANFNADEMKKLIKQFESDIISKNLTPEQIEEAAHEYREENKLPTPDQIVYVK